MNNKNNNSNKSKQTDKTLIAVQLTEVRLKFLQTANKWSDAKGPLELDMEIRVKTWTCSFHFELLSLIFLKGDITFRQLCDSMLTATDWSCRYAAEIRYPVFQALFTMFRLCLLDFPDVEIRYMHQ